MVWWSMWSRMKVNVTSAQLQFISMVSSLTAASAGSIGVGLAPSSRALEGAARRQVIVNPMLQMAVMRVVSRQSLVMPMDQLTSKLRLRQ